ncbi:phage protein [Streptococcus anginosus]|uniref:Phage protein n=2 Tax=Streptococcus anginosus TaxID=1328 RepID=A0A4V6L9C6_STRAP|nr:phage protein [Streptococcus anginosus]
MSRAEMIRKVLHENPTLTTDEVAETVGTTPQRVRAYIAKDIKAGRCVRNADKTIDYSIYFTTEEEINELNEWKNEIRKQLIEQLLEANRRETASDQIRLNAKEINKLLNEVNK